MKKALIFLSIMVFGITGGYLYFKEGTLPVNKNEKESKIFVISKGDELTTIANNLSNEKLIRNKIVFFFVVKQMGIEKNIQAGDFRLSSVMDVYEIAQNLTHGTLDIWVTIIEGLRKEEIAQIISKEFSIPEIEFVNLAQEGYLFPDTYLIPRQATAESILTILKNNFYQKYTPELAQKAKGLKLSESEVVTLASLVEREARFDSDRQGVANVLLKRLSENWPLQIDATIQYALGYQPVEKTWWKINLTHDDLEVDSPYNTYRNTGLPPGSICNPGLASLQAVVNADPNTAFRFYVSDKNGHLHFARTIEEHNENIRKYVQ
ncbi:endolytic transglycosylase MltG [Candidatus Roizmanbacteria bacterium CG09_land_8_20_14_0_10_41_9]|uniref:Endolytic murein transglycosylase n=1 Tax=Candidatus Roizmanbacteria bacterium CG09_land_8_20_14_0_10_41_9 TaxID=1974850 RepID=A0A2H0WTM0_9BACT|nr:MAG: endolytic transglycosylase MltG [Candidatus Roizmanbacteria bacterium CG09_land_8_20_14_0_10_41_9]